MGPETIADLEGLIQVKAQEDIHLEYKDSRALDPSKKSEIAKDVSAFANSDGGVLIYGISEEGHFPVVLDQGAEDKKINREWIEQIILSNISPVIEGVVIKQIPVSEGRSAYVVSIPKSYRAPHQEKNSKKYYKRHNFKVEGMEDYEISDVRARALTIESLVGVDSFLRHRNLAYFSIENIGSAPAYDVNVTFVPEPRWRRGIRPPLVERGMKYLAPGKRHLLFYDSLVDIFKEGGGLPSEFMVTASYRHPRAIDRITDEFFLDFRDFLHTAAVDSDLVEQGKNIGSELNKLLSELQQVKRQLEKIAAIAGPTGLDLSFRTIQNLRHLMMGRDLVERLDPIGQGSDFFEEVLGVDSDMSHELLDYFWSGAGGRRLADIPGMTPELKGKIEAYLRLGPELESTDET